MKKIILFSPSRYSLYSSTIAEMLIQRGILISAIYVRKLLDPQRFFSEFQRDGSRLLKKIWKKLVLRKAAYRPRSFETILDLRNELNIQAQDLDHFRSHFSVPVHYCQTLNDPIVVAGLKELRPELVIFTGGGLIRDEILENAGAGVLNCHMGILPRYRGMDVVEWPILERQIDQIGMTVHFMDKGLDTGDILRSRRVHIQPGETLQELRDRMEPIMCQTLVDTCMDYLDGKIVRTPQGKLDGKQYFKIHPRLMKIAADRLSLSTLQKENE